MLGIKEKCLTLWQLEVRSPFGVSVGRNALEEHLPNCFALQLPRLCWLGQMRIVVQVGEEQACWKAFSGR